MPNQVKHNIAILVHFLLKYQILIDLGEKGDFLNDGICGADLETKRWEELT